MANISAPVPEDFNFITTVDERKARGYTPDSAYIDLVNDLENQKYDLAVREYLYNKYQSPEAMARQYEEAGLNRNFASQSGGNIQAPSDNFKSSYSESRKNSIASDLQTMNSILGLISTGVNTVSELTALPKDLAFKQWRNVAAAMDANIADSKAIQELMKAYYAQSYYGGVKFEPWDMNGVSYDPSNSPAMLQSNLRNELMDIKVRSANWDLDNLKPAQLEQLNEMIENLGARTDFLGLQKDMWSTLKTMGVLTPIIVSLLKLL